MQQLFDKLRVFTHDDWTQTMDGLAGNVHEIDQNATRIWFAFYPLKLHLTLETADDLAARQRKLGLMGRWGLTDTIDSSHRFFYAHRYWPDVKAAIAATGDTPAHLGAVVTQVAEIVARGAKVDRDLVLGITAVGLMTLRQVGPAAFAAAPVHIHLSSQARAKSVKQILGARAKDNSQGLFGFMRGIRKQWTVTFDENDATATFTAVQQQDLATAAQTDKREYRSKDARCIPNEGPIPVECRAASCGTCWVGVLGGAKKLTPVEKHEAVRMGVFGYTNLVEGTQPVIRLACQAKAMGAVSVVIPPWNGIISRL